MDEEKKSWALIRERIRREMIVGGHAVDVEESDENNEDDGERRR